MLWFQLKSFSHQNIVFHVNNIIAVNDLFNEAYILTLKDFFFVVMWLFDWQKQIIPMFFVHDSCRSVFLNSVFILCFLKN